MTRYLVTGATGYIGKRLISSLQKQGNVQVYGLVRELNAPPKGWLPVFGDIQNSASVVGQLKPHIIFHLAAAPRNASLDTQMDVTVTGTQALLEGVIQSGLRPKIVIAGSAAEYGSYDKPIVEDSACMPVTHYGMTKFIQTQLARKYFSEHGLPIVIGRLFNVYGQTDSSYPVAAWANQIAQREFEHELSAVINTQNMRATRDFVHIDDVVQALTALAYGGHPGEIYNIASGRGRKLQDAFNFLTALSLRRYLTSQPEGPQFDDVSVADISKIMQHAFWVPKISLEEGLVQELTYWRNQIRSATTERSALAFAS